MVCANGEDHPACEGCVDGHYVPIPAPWYKSDLIIAIASGVVVAVVSTLLTVRLQRVFERRRSSK